MSEPNERSAPTRKAQMACAAWLAGCLKAGWGRDRLDGLESLWWEHHDDTGKLIAPESAQRAQPEKQPVIDGRETSGSSEPISHHSLERHSP